jgi:hypothetical protein
VREALGGQSAPLSEKVTRLSVVASSKRSTTAGAEVEAFVDSAMTLVPICFASLHASQSQHVVVEIHYPTTRIGNVCPVIFSQDWFARALVARTITFGKAMSAGVCGAQVYAHSDGAGEVFAALSSGSDRTVACRLEIGGVSLRKGTLVAARHNGSTTDFIKPRSAKLVNALYETHSEDVSDASWQWSTSVTLDPNAQKSAFERATLEADLWKEWAW